MARLIFHIDVNSAYLSWEAARRVVAGEDDLRLIPSAIGGDREKRTGVILAKSIPAKKFGVRTGEPVAMALRKCPDLVLARPDFRLYEQSSKAFMDICREYAPVVEKYSIDECWVDMTGSAGLFGPPVLAAEKMKNYIKDKLGFTVNIGISTNKLLAKVAGDFEKPDKVHTLFPHEMEENMWSLPVRDLFSVGPATERKLRDIGITTIGGIARADVEVLRKKLHKPGEVIWHFANGRCDDSLLAPVQENKGYGNSMTTPWDVKTEEEGRQVLLSLCETVGMRLRRDGKRCAVLAVSLRDTEFHDVSHQIPLYSATNVTDEIYEAACRACREMWDRATPLRQIGVHVGKITAGEYRQYSLFDDKNFERLEKVDAAVDRIREKYGESAVFRARFLGDGIAGSMAGGLSKERRTGVTKPVPEEGK